jgi:SMC interacting uncharacterized protein involved in chromosome segregation
MNRQIKYNSRFTKNQYPFRFGIGFARLPSIMKKFAIIAALLLVWVPLAFGQVYKWIDDKGTVHFTDDPSQIPERYRSGVEKSEMIESPGAPKTPEMPTAPNRETAAKDRLGRGEEYWRGRTQEWKKKLDLAQEALEKLRSQYNEVTQKHNVARGPEQRYHLRQERDRLEQEMNKYKGQIEEARRMLDKTIPEEAQLFGAKTEWVKP